MNVINLRSALLFLIVFCTTFQVSAQKKHTSFEEFKKAEKEKFQKYKEEERKKFEAFIKNEQDWNKEILGYKVDTPVSEKVEENSKDNVSKPATPNYVDPKSNLKDELVKIEKRIEKKVPKLKIPDNSVIKKKQTAAKPENNSNSIISNPQDQAKATVVPSNKIVTNRISKESLIEAEVRTIPSAKPIWDNFRISSKFGNRFHPTLFRWRFHGGVDMACTKGTKIHVPADGVVVKSGWNGGYGNYIKIKHGNGFETVYGHLSKISIKKGDKIFKGDVIGEVGSTGRSTGPHLHYEILKNNKRVDPERFFG